MKFSKSVAYPLSLKLVMLVILSVAKYLAEANRSLNTGGNSRPPLKMGIKGAKLNKQFSLLKTRKPNVGRGLAPAG